MDTRATVEHANGTHSCNVLCSPWDGVYATEITSARHYGRHWHATYGLGVIDAGAHRSASGHGAVDAFAGDIVCTNPGEVHDGRPLGMPWRRWRTVYIDPAIIAALQAEMECTGGDAAFTSAAFRDAGLQRRVRRLLDALAAWTDGLRDASQALACEEAMADACGRMLTTHATTQARADDMPADVRRVAERLADAPHEAPALTELAALAGLGRFQLLRRFKQAFGTTPHTWLVQQRVDKARTLLQRGVPIAQASAACGFADQSHLTRAFVQRLGFTPGAWARAHRPATQ